MTKTHPFAVLGGWDHLPNLHLFSRDNHSIHQEFNQLAFLLKARLREALADSLAKRFHRLGDPSQVPPACGHSPPVGASGWRGQPVSAPGRAVVAGMLPAAQWRRGAASVKRSSG